MLNGPRLATMRPQHERVHVSIASEVVENDEVRVRVVLIVRVARVLFDVPFEWGEYVGVKQRVLRLRLVVDRIKSYHVLEELVQVGMRTRVIGCLKQRFEDVLQNLLEVVNQFVALENIVQSWYLY
uniref:Uncharacterized protein n=1 Tax=Cacopsylla melanoneura TaxID=428564 RepID=A0A8D9B1E3_9HEMI